jgi:hypothetical protein
MQAAGWCSDLGPRSLPLRRPDNLVSCLMQKTRERAPCLCSCVALLCSLILAVWPTRGWVPDSRSAFPVGPVGRPGGSLAPSLRLSPMCLHARLPQTEVLALQEHDARQAGTKQEAAAAAERAARLEASGLADLAWFLERLMASGEAGMLR